MRNLIAIPVVILTVALQTTIIAYIPLINGYGDLPLVMLSAWILQPRVETGWHWALLTGFYVGFISGINPLVYIIGYASIVMVASMMQARIWQSPLLGMFSVTFVSSILLNFLSYVATRITSGSISFVDAFGLLMLPSILINMIIATPVYTIMRDLARWVYPDSEDQ